MPTVEELFEACKKLTQSKGEDYVTDIKTDRFENFSRSALVSSWFKDDRDRVYATLIAIKLARLAALLSTDKTPNHESIEDTFKDLINYPALWASDRLSREEYKVGTLSSVIANIEGYTCLKCGGFVFYNTYHTCLADFSKVAHTK